MIIIPKLSTKSISKRHDQLLQALDTPLRSHHKVDQLSLNKCTERNLLRQLLEAFSCRFQDLNMVVSELLCLVLLDADAVSADDLQRDAL